MREDSSMAISKSNAENNSDLHSVTSRSVTKNGYGKSTQRTKQDIEFQPKIEVTNPSNDLVKEPDIFSKV